MRAVLAYPGTMAHAQQIALALHERSWLQAFVTSLSFRRDGWTAQTIARLLPGNAAQVVRRQLARRRIDSVPEQLVHSYPAWEVLRTAVEKGGGGPALADTLWDVASHRFDATVAGRHVPGAEAIHAFEYTALASFEKARRLGIMRILHLPALDNTHIRHVLRREMLRWPDLELPAERHLEARFGRRQERRLREIELADVIVCNSALTALSHVRAGADPGKVRVVPLAAPPVLREVRAGSGELRRMLRVIFAGTFGVLKGAHHLIEAWRLLDARLAARLDVYGSVQLPGRVVARGGDSITLHGPVPQSTLRDAFAGADVLVLPSLADGFGMAVTEAMACGLPVIVSDQAGAADLVNSHNGLVVAAGDARALADALRWCLDNRGPLQAMRRGALATARRRPWAQFRRELIGALADGREQQRVASMAGSIREMTDAA